MSSTKKYVQYIIAGSIICLGFFVASFIGAQTNSPDTITFPVAELGNCANKAECKAYCDNPEHISDCVEFADSHNLMSKDEAKKAKKFAKAKQGPGGCKNMQECETFCNDVNNIDSCLEFAEKNDLMDKNEVLEARKVAAAVRQGAKLPGGCRDRQRCEEYCHMPDHIEECIEFGEKAGLIPAEELAEARKMAKALKAGHKLPGGCKDKKQCENYCFEPSHMDECVAFAEASGLASGEELEHMKKAIPLMQRGEMPGGCRSKDQCEAYCKDETHFEECSNFAVKAGFMKPEEAEQFRKTGGRGPGGCRGREECEAFCNNPDNQQSCIDFAKQHNLIPEEELRHVEEGAQRVRGGFQDAPGEVQECLKNSLGTEILEKMRSGNLLPGPQIGESVRKCFEEFSPKPEHEGEFPRPGEDRQEGTFQGPGGCKTPEECKAYCSDPAHAQECGQQFRPEEHQDGSILPKEGFLKEGAVQEHFDTFKERTQEFYREGLPPEGFHIIEPSGTTQTYTKPPEPYYPSPDSTLQQTSEPYYPPKEPYQQPYQQPYQEPYKQEFYQQPTSGTTEQYSGGTTTSPIPTQ